jgi:hypothetical protein
MNNIYENKLKKYKSKYLKLKNEYNSEGGRYLFFPSEREKNLEIQLIYEKEILEQCRAPIIELQNQLDIKNVSIDTTKKKIKELNIDKKEKENILNIIELKKEYIISIKMNTTFKEEIKKAIKKNENMKEEKKIFILFEEKTVIKKAINDIEMLKDKANENQNYENALIRTEQIKILKSKITDIEQQYNVAIGNKQLSENEKKQEIEKIHEQKVLITILSLLKDHNKKKINIKKNNYETQLRELNENNKIETILQEILKNTDIYVLQTYYDQYNKLLQNTINNITSENNNLKTLKDEYNQLYNNYEKENLKYLEQKNIVDRIIRDINTWFI